MWPSLKLKLWAIWNCCNVVESDSIGFCNIVCNNFIAFQKMATFDWNNLLCAILHAMLHCKCCKPLIGSALMQYWLGRHCDTLNGTLVSPTANTEEAILAPACSPAVLHNPILLLGLFVHSITNCQHGMVCNFKWIKMILQTCKLTYISVLRQLEVSFIYWVL